MKVKTTEWIDFKKQVLSVLELFEKEAPIFVFPLDEPDEFQIIVGARMYFLVSIKKINYWYLNTIFHFAKRKLENYLSLGFMKHIA